jgi:hypothetical protein
MHEVNLDNAAKYILVGISMEGNPSSYTMFNQNAITLLRNAADYLTNPHVRYNYTTNQPEVVLSSDAALSSLTVSEGTLTPVFTPEHLHYAVEVDSTVTSITLTATANHPAATVSGDGVKSLVKGHNPFTITVTAQDGTVKEYSVTVRVLSAGVEPLSDDANLSSLMVSAGTLTPDFSPAITSYAVEVEYAVSSITITADANHPAAFVDGTGEHHLLEGNNTFNIDVTAENSATKTYTVNVTRAALVLSNTATIAALTVNGVAADIDHATGDITCELPSSVSGAIPVVFVLDDPNATTNFGSGGKHNFIGGTNPLKIIVTAQDGVTTKTYTVRATFTTQPSLSDDADLSSLAVSAGTLTPAFSADHLDYTVEVDYAVSSITITADANHAAASVTGTGEKPLTVGDNTFNIVVTAEDGVSTKTYAVKVTRGEDEEEPPVPPTSAGKNEAVNLWYANGTLYNPNAEKVTIYTSAGAAVVRSAGEATLDLARLPPGVYIAKTDSGKTLKFVR